MKTTLEMPEGLFREVKSRAAREGKTMGALVCEFLAAGLGGGATKKPVRKRLEFPLIKKGLAGSLDLTNERIAAIELQEEVGRYEASMRR